MPNVGDGGCEVANRLILMSKCVFGLMGWRVGESLDFDVKMANMGYGFWVGKLGQKWAENGLV